VFLVRVRGESYTPARAVSTPPRLPALGSGKRSQASFTGRRCSSRAGWVMHRAFL